MNAIIGKPGVGKSTILELINREGFSVLDCDKWIHEQYNCDSPIQQEMIATFGLDIIVEGKIEREKLKAIIIEDKTAINKIMNITHRPLFDFLSKNAFDYVEISALEYSPINFSTLFSKIFRVCRELEINSFYQKIGTVRWQFPSIKIKNKTPEEATQKILGN